MCSRVGGIEKQSYSDHRSISITFKLAKLTLVTDYVCAVPVCECCMHSFILLILLSSSQRMCFSLFMFYMLCCDIIMCPNVFHYKSETSTICHQSNVGGL